MTKPATSKGFGFEPDRAAHYFLVRMPRGEGGVVTIQEVFDTASEGVTGAQVIVDKVQLDPYRWKRIAEVTRATFNKHLKQMGLPSGRWLARETPVAAHLGKELTLLAWAIEGADPTIIPNIVGNWMGLQPEERWWLYTTVNASAGHVEYGRDRGWRKAIKIAFAENPVSAAASVPIPDEQLPLLPVAEEDAPASKRARKHEPAVAEGQETLFGSERETTEDS